MQGKNRERPANGTIDSRNTEKHWKNWQGIARNWNESVWTWNRRLWDAIFARFARRLRSRSLSAGLMRNFQLSKPLRVGCAEFLRLGRVVLVLLEAKTIRV